MNKRTLYGLGLLLALTPVVATGCGGGSGPSGELQEELPPELTFCQEAISQAVPGVMVTPDYVPVGMTMKPLSDVSATTPYHYSVGCIPQGYVRNESVQEGVAALGWAGQTYGQVNLSETESVWVYNLADVTYLNDSFLLGNLDQLGALEGGTNVAGATCYNSDFITGSAIDQARTDAITELSIPEKVKDIGQYACMGP